jgi:hypothetical protein
MLVSFLIRVPFCKVSSVTFYRIHVMLPERQRSYSCRSYYIMEYLMITVLKFLVGAILGSLAWLVTGYTVEYFRPYKPVKAKVRKD